MTANDQPLVSLQGVGFTYKTRAGLLGHRKYEALSDINFDVNRGETLGVIGRNGCGKSTLLRILSGIYRPDKGRIARQCERISLLSLQIGFDPELSGTHNLILACMFLGASRAEAMHSHDEIVEFAELEDFINEPLKTYSTGMRARLGFSVGMTMHADLLLIDEVLGVGDGAFRQKATDAMKNRINSDQSVIFVSHGMHTVKELCHRVLWLEGGRIREQGEPDSVIAHYLEEMQRVRGVGNTEQRESELTA